MRPVPIVLAVLGLCASCGDAPAPRAEVAPTVALEAPSEPWFHEDAAAAGLDFEHVFGAERRFDFPEIMGGGVGLFDADGDGDLDVYFVQSGDLRVDPAQRPGNQLYRNLGDGRFEDATAGSGADDRGYGMGCAAADFDRDGDLDLYVTNVGANTLLANRGDGTFEDVTARAGVGHPGWGTSTVFLDYDGDGWLDLFVANYIDWSLERELECREDGRDYCHPVAYAAPAVDTLYRNRGDGTFEDVTAAAGLAETPGNGLGVVCGDFDGDGREDIYVANDMNPNRLWMQTAGGRFEDRALTLGCALSGSGSAEAGMGVQAFDLEDDGDLDLFMTHLRHQSNTCYVNLDGRGNFADRTLMLGLASSSIAFTGFGLGFADFDHDTRLDLFVANGSVMVEPPFEDPADPYAQANLLLRGEANGRFAELLPRGGTLPTLVATSRGAAFGDLDGDGDVDVVVSNVGGPCHLLRNAVGARGHWIELRLIGEHGVDDLGAMVRLRSGERTIWRRLDGGYSYCSSNAPRVHVGLGDRTQVDEVLVRWRDGTESTWTELASDRRHELRRDAR